MDKLVKLRINPFGIAFAACLGWKAADFIFEVVMKTSAKLIIAHDKEKEKKNAKGN